MLNLLVAQQQALELETLNPQVVQPQAQESAMLNQLVEPLLVLE